MTIGIVGLGLIGGSLAKAYKRDTSITVLGFDLDKSTMDYAALAGIIDGTLSAETLASCDLVLVCTYPAASVDYMRQNADRFSKTGIVMDCVGTKQEMCRFGFALAKEHGFTFVGGHPMGGSQYAGIKYADAALFNNAPMVIVPPVYDDMAFLHRLEELLKPAGFGRISVTTAPEHDRMIAYTSQLCHIVSNAFIKSPTAALHKGYSAGSYKDLTRVAQLNPDMWSELMLENRENITMELDTLIDHLQEYRTAIVENNSPELRQLLEDGRIRKEQIDV